MENQCIAFVRQKEKTNGKCIFYNHRINLSQEEFDEVFKVISLDESYEVDFPFDDYKSNIILMDHNSPDDDMSYDFFSKNDHNFEKHKINNIILQFKLRQGKI